MNQTKYPAIELTPLQRIAQELMTQAQTQARSLGAGLARHQLSGGLHLTFQIRGNIRILSLTRYGRQASETERQLVRQAFGVPVWVTYAEHYEFDYQNGWGILRIRWSSSRWRKELLVAQGHLAPGWSLHRRQELFDRLGIGPGPIPEDKLDQIIGEIYGESQ